MPTNPDTKVHVFRQDGWVQVDLADDRFVFYSKTAPAEGIVMNEPFRVTTLEGEMTGQPGDVLMRGAHGELYPCARAIFDDTYEQMSNSLSNVLMEHYPHTIEDGERTDEAVVRILSMPAVIAAANGREALVVELSVNIEEVLDSEIDEIQSVFMALGEKQKTQQHMESFRKECVERFLDIGFICDPKVWSTNVEGVFIFELELIGRTEAKAFDRERMSHEVQSDLLGLGEGGKIDANGLWRPN